MERSTAIYAPCTLPYFQKLRRCRLNHSLAACLFVCLLPSPSLTFQCTRHKAHITLLQSVIQILAPARLLFCKSPVSMWYFFGSLYGRKMMNIQWNTYNVHGITLMWRNTWGPCLTNMSLLNRRLWWQGRRSCANQKTHSDAESRGWTEQRSLYPEDLVSQIHQIHGLRTLLKKENTVICELWQADDLDTTGDSLEERETLACSSNLVQQAQIQKIFKENCKFQWLYFETAWSAGT